MVEDVHLVIVVGRDRFSGVMLLIEERPNVHDKYHCQEYCPSRESPQPSTQAFLVKERTDRYRSYNLGEPVNQVIQRTRTDIKQSAVVFIEFCKLSLNTCPYTQK